MPSTTRKCLALCLCFLFLGVLIGISIDVKFRPNRMRFWVNGVNELSFFPQEGDKIEWFSLATGHLVNTISFPGDSPCVGTTTNPCKIANLPEGATYLYTCGPVGDPNFCFDPQGGPTSKTNGVGFFTRIFDLIQNVFATFIQIFSPSPQPGAPRNTHNMTGGAATDQTKIVEPLSGKAKPTVTYPPIQVQLYCSGSGASTTVYVPQQSGDTPDPQIQASVGQKIQFGTASPNGLTVSFPDPSTCSPSTSTLSANGICTFAKPGSYTALVAPCTQNSESIALPPN